MEKRVLGNTGLWVSVLGVGTGQFGAFGQTREADCVQIAHAAGITAVIQPGGSIRDKDSIDYCVEHKMAMVVTGMRHFRH